jgi:outer membrane protein assembly factor BamB
MNNNDEFSPENVDEQIDHLTYSSHLEPLSSENQVIRELHAYYKEDQRSTERIWERLTPYVAKRENTISPDLDQPEAVNETFGEKMLVRKPEQHSARWKGTSHLALIAAIFCAFLVIGSLLFVLQIVHSNHTISSSPSASSRSLYISEGGEVSKLDIQTRKTIWRTMVTTKFVPGNLNTLAVFHETVYLSLASSIYALNTSDGHVRWSQKILNAFPPTLNFVDGLLYTQTVLANKPVLYALNPANGKIEATYTKPNEQGQFGKPTIANGILYSATSTDLYAISLKSQQIVWHQPLNFSSTISILGVRLGVKNGILYVQAVMQTVTKVTGLIMAFDATTGNKLWHSNTNAVILATTDNIIYTTENESSLAPSTQRNAFNALDAHTGKLLWHQSINFPKGLASSDWNLFTLTNADSLYVVIYDNDNITTGVVALKVRNGRLLWQANLKGENGSHLLGIQNGILYTTSYDNKNNAAINAFKASNGSLLWQMPLQAGDLWTAILA